MKLRLITVFVLYSAIFLVNVSSGRKDIQGKETSTSDMKPFKWNPKNWIIEAKPGDTKDFMIKQRVRRHLFKKGEREQPPVVIINRYEKYSDEESGGWGPPPPPPPPTKGWTRPTTTTTTTTTTRPPPPPTHGWGWAPPTTPPPQHGWGGGDPGPEIQGGHTWNGGGKGGILGFPHRVIQSGLSIFKKPESAEESDEYERKTYGISIYKNKERY